MAVIGFSLNKINVEKKPEIKGKISIKNNVTIKDIEKADLFLGKAKQSALRFIFEYTSSYEPKMASILLEGHVLFVEEDKKAKKILDDWKKNKRIEPEVMATLLNNILAKCNIEALMLSRDTGLPPPVPMPKVNVKK